MHSKSSLDIRNLESVFTTFEMAKNIGRLGNLRQTEINKCVQSLQAVIFYTLDKCVLFPTTGAGDVVAPEAYRRFATCIEASRADYITVITFNYDVALDVAFADTDLEVFYALGDPPTHGNYIDLLKLHGSISWGLTKRTKKIVPCPASALTKNLSRPQGSIVPIDLTVRLKQLIREHQRAEITPTPLIVPPGLYKTDYQGSLTDVWKAAAEALIEAEEIFVFGYSLPSTDFFFQNLYALGTVGPTILRKFCVFDPNPTVETRFSNLLGPGAKSVFQFKETTFDAGADTDGGTGDFFGSLSRPLTGFTNRTAPARAVPPRF